MRIPFIKKTCLLFFCAFFIYSCDKDYNSVGDSILGDNHFDFSLYTSEVVTYNQKVGPVASNNLAVSPFGVLKLDYFDTTTANFAAELTLSELSPTLGTNPTIKSAILYIPYFTDSSLTTYTSSTTDGVTTTTPIYVLDSIYGSLDSKMKLSIYESGYRMNNTSTDGGLSSFNSYYTDQNSTFDAAKIGTRLNNSEDISQNDEFVFSELQHTVVASDDTESYLAPGMRLNLDATFFQSKILDTSESNLASEEVFKNYYRGLYFKIEKGTDDGAMAMLDFSAGTIIITYDYTNVTTDSDDEETSTLVEDATITLNLSGNTVSLLDQTDIATAYSDAITSANINRTSGDETIYLKGGQGAIGIIEILSDTEIETINENGWLINEANLVFYVKDNDLTNDPQRLFLFDIDNNTFLSDYFTDLTSGTTTKDGKTTYGGILEQNSSGEKYYKFRITNHVINILENDSDNVKLGIGVTENINLVTFSELKTTDPDSDVSKAPKASVMNPLGTILYGSNLLSTDPNYDKRVKLEIYYTKTN